MAKPDEARSAARPERSGTLPFALLLGLGSAASTSSVREHVLAGLPFAAFERLRESLELPPGELAELVQIAPRTLDRRRREGRLQPVESDRLVRAARVVADAIELFEGDREAARRWLERPSSALGGVTPLVMARTEIGAREVEQLIGRLEHGVVS